MRRQKISRQATASRHRTPRAARLKMQSSSSAKERTRRWNRQPPSCSARVVCPSPNCSRSTVQSLSTNSRETLAHYFWCSALRPAKTTALSSTESACTVQIRPYARLPSKLALSSTISEELYRSTFRIQESMSGTQRNST